MSDLDDSFYSARDSLSASLDESYSANRCLNSELQHFTTCFHVCHVNAQSIPRHHSDLLDIVGDTPLHAILVSESWLKPELRSSFFSVPGYVLIRNDRTGKRAGGVAIYLRSDIPHKILAASAAHHSGNPEYLLLEIVVSGAKVALGVIYCPPTIDYFYQLETLLESISCDYRHLIIMGDFNTDLAKNTSRSQQLRSILESLNLFLVPLNPTHVNSESNDTWLDLIFVSDKDLIKSQGQIAVAELSGTI